MFHFIEDLNIKKKRALKTLATMCTLVYSQKKEDSLLSTLY